MSTLIESFDYRGRPNGRCDAKCYDAEASECECLCGGENHGKGKETAIENTIRRAATWAAAWRLKHPETVKVDVRVRQMELIGGREYVRD